MQGHQVMKFLAVNIVLMVMNLLFCIFYFGYRPKHYEMPFRDKLWKQEWKLDENNPRIYMVDEVKKIITIGMKQQQVLKKLGEPDVTKSDGTLVSWEYYLGQYGPAIDCDGLLLRFDENKRIVDFIIIQH